MTGNSVVRSMWFTPLCIGGSVRTVQNRSPLTTQSSLS